MCGPMITALKILLLTLAALILDLGLDVVIRRPWPVPPFSLILVLYLSLRRGETLAMILGWILGYIFDILNQGTIGTTSFVLVCVGFSPWPFRKSRELTNRFIHALLCAANVLVSFAIVLGLTASRGLHYPSLNIVIRESLILACICLILLFLLYPVMDRLVKPYGEIGA